MGKQDDDFDGLDDFLNEFMEDERESKKPKEKVKTKSKPLPTPDEILDEFEESDRFVATYTSDEIDDGNDDIYDDGIDSELRAILDWRPAEPRSTEYMLENEFITSGWVGFLHLDQILTDAILTGASDVHIVTNQTVSMTRNGDIIRNDEYIIPDGETMTYLVTGGLLNNQQQAILNSELEYDGSYELVHGPLRGRRTRINVGISFGQYFVIFRIINDFIPMPEDLGIEQEIRDWAKFPNGLFLLCGPTGSGKSTSLASIVHEVQRTTSKKIITIEKPIEYIYPDDSQALVVQSEVGNDTLGFYEGLTSAMRQNPDIILLGEVRNTEEVQELLRAAETGHLAISTMHTNSAATTINRIQNLFEGDEQRRIMSTLADTLRGVGNQVLVKDKNDGRFAVRELLSIDDEIRDLIIEGDVRGIRNYQIARKSTMEHKLALAVKSGQCLKSEAIKHSSDPKFFLKLLEE